MKKTIEELKLEEQELCNENIRLRNEKLRSESKPQFMASEISSFEPDNSTKYMVIILICIEVIKFIAWLFH